MKVLIFDDNASVELELTMLMKSQGYEVFSFNSSEKVLIWLEDEKNVIDLALLDIVENPILFEKEKEEKSEDREAGFKIASRLKEINRDLPIVFFSAYGDDPEIKQMVKAFSPYELFEKGVDDDEGIGGKAKDRILKRIKMVLNEKKKILVYRDYFSQTKFGKIIIERESYQHLTSSDEKILPRTEKKGVEFLIKIDSIIKVEKIYRDKEGDVVEQVQLKKKEQDKITTITHYEKRKGGEKLKVEKASEYLSLTLDHKYHKVFIPSVKPLDFFRQMNVLFDINKKPNPFISIRNGVYLNINYIEEIEFASDDTKQIKYRIVRGVIDTDTIDYAISTEMPSEGGVSNIKNCFRSLKSRV